jgi:ribonuclease PH
MMRKDGRLSDSPRPLSFTIDYTAYALGSVLVCAGNTKVLCTVTLEEGVPPWMRGSKPAKGWLNAEYSMLPSATHQRTRRERSHVGGRTQEIQRLIGRSLRGIMDFSKCPDYTFVVDCDVIQADGGTRTASITGAYVALKIAVKRMLRSGKLQQDPLKEGIAAISVGIKNDRVLLDLDYEEDSSCDIDMNVVMTHGGRLLELQGTAENSSFSREQVTAILDRSMGALEKIKELQNAAVESARA